MSDAVATQNAGAQLAAVTQQDGFYTSLQLSSQKDKLNMLKIISASQPMVDHVGDTVAIKDVIITTAEFTDDETGELTTGLRTTIIDEDGNAFHAASKGIALALRTVFGVLGEPGDWEEPYKVVIREGRKGKFRYLTLDPAE